MITEIKTKDGVILEWRDSTAMATHTRKARVYHKDGQPGYRIYATEWRHGHGASSWSASGLSYMAAAEKARAWAETGATP